MRGQITDIIKGFQGMSQVRQVQKWQLAQKEKSADFKSPDFGSSAYCGVFRIKGQEHSN